MRCRACADAGGVKIFFVVVPPTLIFSRRQFGIVSTSNQDNLERLRVSARPLESNIDDGELVLLYSANGKVQLKN